MSHSHTCSSRLLAQPLRATLGLVNGCTKDLLDRLWAEEVEGQDIHFSWISQNRRTSRDCERLCASAEAFIYVAMSPLTVRRLACS